MSSLQFVSLSSEGEVRPEVFEIQLSAFSDHDQRSKNFFRKKAWESYLTLIDRITCVSTEGRGQAVNKPWTARGQTKNVRMKDVRGVLFPVSDIVFCDMLILMTLL